jgi:hypothetical protein
VKTDRFPWTRVKVGLEALFVLTRTSTTSPTLSSFKLVVTLSVEELAESATLTTASRSWTPLMKTANVRLLLTDVVKERDASMP